MALAVAGVLLPATPAGADADDPAQWPSGSGTDPNYSASAHSVRFSGPDRYQTNLAATLALRGRGDYPFDTPDRTSGGAGGLSQATDWWGAQTCPYAVLVVAGDTFADALTAASLSDPTNRSTEPRVQRVAASDPLFDPVGGFDRVDTDGAPIIVTRSARSGGTSLTPAARVALSDLANGGCRTARNAIIVGGEAAVPPAVASEIVGLGYSEVFRVAGGDRYETAARVAAALGTGAPSATACIDPDAADGDVRMGFYGNAAVEFRPEPGRCRLLSRSVVLADGGTGADALAAGWWTSFWQVPILLTAPDGSLPPATRAALQTLDVDNVIVLGGTGRIPERTADEAAAVANAAVGRIAGVDRYATSAEMARVFGGWHPSTDGSLGRASLVCLAASSGSGDAATGWPDALAAGPWCGRANGAAADPRPPTRALPDVEGPFSGSHQVGLTRPALDAVPVLLTPTGGGIPSSVASLLGSVFEPSAAWCTADVPGPSCLEPGFGVVFGGTAAVPEASAQQLARLVSGSTYGGFSDLAPTMTAQFPTYLDLWPVFGVPEVAGPRLCVPRGALGDVRWLVTSADERRTSLIGSLDAVESGIYRSDQDGTARTPRRSAPWCVASAATSWLTPLSISGRVGPAQAFDIGPARRTASSLLSDPSAEAVEGQASGTPPGSGGSTTWSFDQQAPAGSTIDLRGRQVALRAWSLRLTLLRAADESSPNLVLASVALDTTEGSISASASAEAFHGSSTWTIRGRFAVAGGDLVPAGSVGGFTATVDLGSTSTDADDTVRWRFDAFE